MKVALISPEERPVPPIDGGAVEQILYETACHVQDPELFVISPQPNKPICLASKDKTRFLHVDIQAQKLHVQSVLSGQLPQSLKHNKSAKEFYYLMGVTDLIETLNPHVIEIHNRPHFAAYLARQFPDKQIVFFMHSNKFSKFDHRDLSLPQINRLIFVSHDFQQKFLLKHPESKNKTDVIHNAVNTHQWHPKLKTHPLTKAIRSQHQLPRGYTLLFVGRMVKQKGIHLLVDAVKQIQKKIPQIKLLAVGSPEFKNHIDSDFFEKLKFQARPLGDTIIFTNYIDRNETPYYYAAADLIVMPSIGTEGLPLVALESGAAGIPLLGSRCGGIPEVIQHNKTGVLIHTPENTHDLATQIYDLLSHPTHLKKMGDAARQHITSHFSQSVRQANLKTYYNTLKLSLQETTYSPKGSIHA